MPSRRSTRYNKGRSQYYETKPKSRTTQDEHRRRILLSIDMTRIPKDWDEFKLLSVTDQWEMAKIISIAVDLLELMRTPFTQGVLQEYEWVLSEFWDYCCDDCNLPVDFCRSL